MKTREIAAGDSFERHIEVSAASVLSFEFSGEDGATLQFSVLLRNAKGKETRLLPASSYSALSGEVLLPGPGTCIARWHNANTSWIWSSTATLHYTVSCQRPAASAVPAAKPTPVAQSPAATATTSESPPPPPPPQHQPDAGKPEPPAAVVVVEDAAANLSASSSKTPSPPVKELGETLARPLDPGHHQLRDDLLSRNILHPSEAPDPVSSVAVDLGRALAVRPGAQELARRGILKLLPADQSAGLQDDRPRRRGGSSLTPTDHCSPASAAPDPSPPPPPDAVIEEQLLTARTDAVIPTGGTIDASLSIPCAGELYLRLTTPDAKPTDLSAVFTAGEAMPSAPTTAGKHSLASASGAIAVKWRDGAPPTPTASVPGCSGACVLRAPILGAGVVRLTFAHVSTAWLFESSTPLSWWATFVPRSHAAYLTGGAGQLSASLTHTGSPLVPATEPPSSYEAQMRKAMDEALAKAMQQTKGGAACRPGTKSLVTTGLASPARANTSANTSAVPASAPPPADPPPAAPVKSGSGRLMTTLTIQPTERTTAVPSDRLSAIDNADEAFGSLLEAAAAVRVQSLQRVRLARQESGERRAFAAAVEAAADATIAEVEQQAVEVEAAAQAAAGRRLGVATKVAIAAVRLQSAVRMKYAQAEAEERRAFVRAAEASMVAAEASLEAHTVAVDELIAARQHSGSSVASETTSSDTPSGVARAAAISTPLPSSSATSVDRGTPASVGPKPRADPLPTSALVLLEELGLAKYHKSFLREDLTETSMFTAMLHLDSGPNDLRAILREVGVSVGHRERLLLALTTRPPAQV